MASHLALLLRAPLMIRRHTSTHPVILWISYPLITWRSLPNFPLDLPWNCPMLYQSKRRKSVLSMYCRGIANTNVQLEMENGDKKKELLVLSILQACCCGMSICWTLCSLFRWKIVGIVREFSRKTFIPCMERFDRQITTVHQRS